MLFPLLSPQPTVERPLKGPPRGLGGPFLFSRPLLTPETSALLTGHSPLASWTISARLSLFLSGDRLTRPSGHPASLFSRLFKSRYGPQSRPLPAKIFGIFARLNRGTDVHGSLCGRISRAGTPFFAGAEGGGVRPASQKRGAPARLSARPVSFGGARNPSSGGQDPVQASLENNTRLGNSPKIQSPFYGHIISSIKKLYRIKNRRELLSELPPQKSSEVVYALPAQPSTSMSLCLTISVMAVRAGPRYCRGSK